MAEGAIAIVGLVMATYATIDLIIKHTDLLASGLSTHHSLKEATQNLADFQVKNAKTELCQQLDLAQQILRVGSDEEAKKSLSNSFEDIQVYLIKAKDLLSERDRLTTNDYHDYKPTRRARKKVLAEEIKVSLKTLKAAKDHFTSITSTAAMQKALPSSVLLTNDDFRIIRTIAAAVPDQSSLVEASLSRQGETAPKTRGLFLLEVRESPEADIRSFAETLASARGPATSSANGVLTCAGYRNADERSQTGKYHLVFALPAKHEIENSLQRLMQDCSSTPRAVPPSLNQRVDLCYQLSNAVLQVHKLNLVHKNINSINILAVKPTAAAPGPTTQAVAQPAAQATTQQQPERTIFLADWHLVRKASLASSFAREKDWWRRLYQHPSRHVQNIVEEYTMNHDIYSLGVCMIEILLWQSLLVKTDEANSPVPSQLLQPVVDEVIAGLGLDQGQNPVTAFGDLDGEMVQDILTKIAEAHLPSAVGTRLTELVVNCLTVLEGSFGPISFAGQSALETTSNFMTTIQSDLWNFKLAI